MNQDCSMIVQQFLPSSPSTNARARRRGSTTMLDLTALGRQEAWEEPKGRASVVHDT